MNPHKFENYECPRKLSPKLLSSFSSIATDLHTDFESFMRSHSPRKQLKSYIFNTPDPNLRSLHMSRSKTTTCPECVKNRSITLECQRNFEISQERLLSTDKHLKQYDSLLSIKEKRLKEQDAVLKAEKDAFISEKKKFDDFSAIENERIAEQSGQIEKDKLTINKKVEELAEKYNEVKAMITEYESNREKLESEIRYEVFEDLKVRTESLEHREFELSNKIDQFNNGVSLKVLELREYEESLKQSEDEIDAKELKLNSKFQELLQLQETLNYSKSDIENELREREEAIVFREEEVEREANYLKQQLSNLDSEICNIDMMKSELGAQKEELSHEERKLKELYSEKIEELEKLSNSLNERAENLNLKEENIERLMSNLTEEQAKIQERWDSISEIEKIAEELEFYKSKALQLEKMISSADITMEYSEKVGEITEILREKLEMVNRREAELVDLEKKVEIEREEVNRTALLVSTLNEELSTQREIQREEQQNIEINKERIKTLAEKQFEKEKLLILHEKEINQLRDKLKEKEGLIYLKEKSISSIELQTNSMRSRTSSRVSSHNDSISDF